MPPPNPTMNPNHRTLLAATSSNPCAPPPYESSGGDAEDSENESAEAEEVHDGDDNQSTEDDEDGDNDDMEVDEESEDNESINANDIADQINSLLSPIDLSRTQGADLARQIGDALDGRSINIIQCIISMIHEQDRDGNGDEGDVDDEYMEDDEPDDEDSDDESAEDDEDEDDDVSHCRNWTLNDLTAALQDPNMFIYVPYMANLHVLVICPAGFTLVEDLLRDLANHGYRDPCYSFEVIHITDRASLTPAEIRQQASRQHYNLILAFGLPLLTSETNMSGWLPSWRDLVRTGFGPSGQIMAQLTRNPQEGWQGVFDRYSNMANAVGLSLDWVNGIEELDSFGRLTIRVRHRCFARRLKKLFKRQLNVLGNHSDRLRNISRGLRAGWNLVLPTDRLYGLFSTHGVPGP